MSSSTFYAPLERNRWFHNGAGEISTSKREDEIIQVVIDWSDQLASGETVSSLAYEDSGVTRSSTSATTTTSTTSVTGVGYFEVTATLSTGRKLQRIVNFYGTDTDRRQMYG